LSFIEVIFLCFGFFCLYRLSLFAEVIQAAWSDFNNSAVFTKGKDVIALFRQYLTPN
jgi:hypothetical protein